MALLDGRVTIVTGAYSTAALYWTMPAGVNTLNG